MSGLTSFAILGLGRLGSQVLSALLTSPQGRSLSIRILTRPGSQTRNLLYPPNVSFWPIDYNDPYRVDAQLLQALKGVQVVISTVGAGVKDPDAEGRKLMAMGKHSGFIPGYINQSIVARAAKRAGCKLFVPA